MDGLQLRISGRLMAKRTMPKRDGSGQLYIAEFAWLGGSVDAFVRPEEFNQLPEQGTDGVFTFEGRMQDKQIRTGKLLKFTPAESTGSGRRAA